MVRFLLLALPLLLLLLGGGAFGLELAGLAGAAGAPPGEAGLQLARWSLEAVALTALLLLVQGRGGSWWGDGLLTAGLAWIFRGPLLLLALAELGALPPRPLLAACGWLLLYLAAGVLLGWLARPLEPA